MKSVIDRDEAYQILRIYPPFSESQLKTAFREAAKRLHPDAGGNAEEFIRSRAAYELLLADAGTDRVVDPIARTVNGVPLSTLGRGLRVAASKCHHCSGHGYQEQIHYVSCRICDGWRARHCLTCRGSGLEEGKSVYHICVTCDGVGEVANFNPVFIRNAVVGQKNQARRSPDGARREIKRQQAERLEEYRKREAEYRAKQKRRSE